MKTYLFEGLREIDEILRGERTRPASLVSGNIDVSGRRLIVFGFALGGLYGASMGLYSVVNGATYDAWLQLVSSMLKVPLLFLLTLLVTCPSLYVFSALVGSRLRFASTMRLLLMAIIVDLALLASLGPVTAFFTVCTTSYPFVKLLNVAFFAVSGLVGLKVLSRALDMVFTLPAPPLPVLTPASEATPPEAPTEPKAPPTVLDVLASGPNPFTPRPLARDPSPDEADRTARWVFSLWTFTFGVVGAQMGWVLRPFIGAPDRPFEWFRPRESNILEAIFQAVRDLGT